MLGDEEVQEIINEIYGAPSTVEKHLRPFPVVKLSELLEVSKLYLNDKGLFLDEEQWLERIGPAEMVELVDDRQDAGASHVAVDLNAHQKIVLNTELDSYPLDDAG